MMNTKPTVSRIALHVSILSLGCSLACSGALGAEGDVVTIILGQSFIRDDNLFRLSDGTDVQATVGNSSRSDTISRTEAGVKIDVPVSRQRFLVDVGVAHLRYDRFAFLSHDAYRSLGTWLWEVGNSFKGDVVLERNRSLSGFTDFRLPIKNMNTYSRASASGYYWYHPEWAVGGSLGRIASDNSTPDLAVAEYRNNVFEVGIQHKRSTDNEVGFRLRRTDSDYPVRQDINGRLTDNSFIQNDYFITGSWRITGASTLRGYVGHSERSYGDLSERNFGSPTAKLSYDWLFSPKFTFNFTARRELSSVEDTNPTSLMTRALGAGVIWAATSKINVEGRLERAKREFRADPDVVLLGQPQREDKVRTATVAVTYKPVRSIQLSASYAHETRDSNFANNQYNSNVALVAAQIMF